MDAIDSRYTKAEKNSIIKFHSLYVLLFCLGGTDYVGQSVTLTFTPEMTQQCFNVSIINDDNYELAEEFFVNITTSEDFVDLAPMFTVLTIIDDEGN